MSRIEIDRHPTGPWLVRCGERRLAVPASLGRRLLPWRGLRPERGRGRGDPDDPLARRLVDRLAAAPGPRSGPRVRVRLASADRVVRAARPLTAATSWPAMGLMLMIGAAGYAAAPASGRASGGPPAAILGGAMFLATALWHELGHAAALSREGYRPGVLGAGVLFVFPVLYVDVSAVGLLERSGRLRVDLAGVVFQIAVGGALSAGSGVAPQPWSAAMGWAAGAAALAVAWSLMPWIRSDGYWLLRDLTRGGRAERLVRLVVGLSAAAVGAWAARRWLTVLARLATGEAPDEVVAWTVAAALVLAVGLGRVARPATRRLRLTGGMGYDDGNRPPAKEPSVTSPEDRHEPEPHEDAVPMELDGILDLHTFAPREVKELVPAWLDECRAAGLVDLRIIHGKGVGVLRTLVHGILEARDDVEWFGHPSDGSSWGATLVRMRD